MNPEIRDDLDRTIDEALAAAVAGEPRRVDAASVRLALSERGRSPLPSWLGLAAALLIAGGGIPLLRLAWEPGSSTEVSRPIAAASPSEALVDEGESPSAQAPSRSDPGPVRMAAERPPAGRAPAGARGAIQELTTEPPYEGLPRLTITPLDRPDSLSPREFENREISIAGLEIRPLALAGLSPATHP